MSFDTPEIPKITPVTAAPTKMVQAESEAARRDLEERMRKASMNRSKSVLTQPDLVRPVENRSPMLLSKTLG